MIKFSSPFIEERLYLYDKNALELFLKSSRPLLSRSGCILNKWENILLIVNVLVPFYRGAVVFPTII